MLAEGWKEIIDVAKKAAQGVVKFGGAAALAAAAMGAPQAAQAHDWDHHHGGREEIVIRYNVSAEPAAMAFYNNEVRRLWAENRHDAATLHQIKVFANAETYQRFGVYGSTNPQDLEFQVVQQAPQVGVVLNFGWHQR